MSPSRPAAVIILAAGEGTRMKSMVPKVLHPLCGRSMLGHAIAAARELSPERLIVVVGHRGDEVAAHAVSEAPEAEVVIQDRQGGTGHAVRTVIDQGYRTGDIFTEGTRRVGTREMGDAIVAALG